MRRRFPSSSSTSSDDYASCLGTCCHSIGCCLCLTKMKPSSRIALTWFWTVFIAVICGAIVAKVYFSATSFVLHPTDMRLIEMRSTSMCSEVNIKSYAPIEVFALESEPKVVKDKPKEVYSFQSAKYIKPDRYVFWDFYLLENSEMELQICTEHGSDNVYALVFKGEDNFNGWVDTQGCCFEEKIHVERCGYSGLKTITYKNTENDRYYFVVFYDHRSGTGVNMNMVFQLARTEYDLSGANLECEQDTACTIPADYKFLVVSYPPDKHTKASNSRTVSATCDPQYYVFAAIFVFLPIGVALAITGVIITRSRRARSRSRTESQIFTISDNGTSGAASGIGGPALVLEPPPYSDCCEAPPSYEEVLRLKTLQEEEA